jgi:hypothetical protein
MRLFEVADSFADDLETVLRLEIGKSNSGQPTSKTLSWEALSNLLEPFGYGKIDFNGFKSIYYNNPSIQPLIRNYSEEGGVILGTGEEPEQDQTQTPVPDGPSVDQMANKAVSKGLQPDF